MSDTTPTSSAPSDRPVARQKVPPFARYRGTSAWRKNRRRIHEYAKFRAALKAAEQASAAPNA
ncbi:MAG: hypothetical protein WDN49_19175 [Acetobacteraceae bacterium]